MAYTPIDTDNAEFQNALKLIQYTRQSVFLTGKAGTGKSTFLKHVCQITKQKEVCSTCPYRHRSHQCRRKYPS